ncbi:hypothetical protein [Yokenella regensburgei]|uniref:hypothetical protein n=1 Tax=Yokenella regensburgei TaxID=158877 RepID=UPI003EDAB788
MYTRTPALSNRRDKRHDEASSSQDLPSQNIRGHKKAALPPAGKIERNYRDDGIVFALYKKEIIKKGFFGKTKKESLTDIITFEDQYHGKVRLNIFGHGVYDVLNKRYVMGSTFDKHGNYMTADESDKAIAKGKGRDYYMQDIYNELIERYPTDFGEEGVISKRIKIVRLVSCYSADGDKYSGGQKLADLSKLRVQAHKDKLIMRAIEANIVVGLPFNAPSTGWKDFRPQVSQKVHSIPPAEIFKPSKPSKPSELSKLFEPSKPFEPFEPFEPSLPRYEIVDGELKNVRKK